MEADWSGLQDKWEVGKLRQFSVGDSGEVYSEERAVAGEGDSVGIDLFRDERDLGMFRCGWEGARDRLGRFGGEKSKTSFLVTLK